MSALHVKWPDVVLEVELEVEQSVQEVCGGRAGEWLVKCGMEYVVGGNTG